MTVEDIILFVACGFVLGWMAHVWKKWGDEVRHDRR